MKFVSEGQVLIAKLALFSILSLLLGCEQAYSPSSKSNSNLLIYCSEGSPVSLNPQTSTSGTTIDATSATIFNQLLDYSPGTTDLRPSLAESWEVSDDGTNYRFNIRKNVSFHSNKYFVPSRNLNADDVIFSIQRQKDNKHFLHSIKGERYPYFYGQGLDKLIKHIEKTGEYQVEIELARPESPFLSILATPFLPIQSKEYADQLANNGQLHLFDRNPIGTGPFQLVAYEPDSYLRFKAFPHYFAGNNEINELVYAITPDPAMRFARFSAGECDIMRHPLPVHNKLAKKQVEIEELQTPALNVAYWAFNTEKAPFGSAKVRQALSIAVNRQAILRSVYDNQAVLAESPLNPSGWAYDDNLAKTQFNPKKAKALLSEAGYPDGFELDIWAMPVQRAYNPNARKMAEMIQQDLLEIGVKANIISYQWGSFLKRLRAGQHETVLLGWSADNADPDNFFTPLLSCAASENGSNYARWCNKKFDQIILDARQENLQEKRQAYYQQAQQILAEQKPWLPIAHTPNNLLINNSLKDVNLSPLGTINFEGVTLKNSSDDKEQN